MSDFVFPHTVKYEMPILDIKHQGDFVNLPVAGWGSVSRRTRFKGTWHFYIDDSKFSALWKHADSIFKTKALYAVEPNFSTHQQMQFPVALYRIYQKRWLARYWQLNGIGIFVDLFVAEQYEQLNLHGVPEGWQAYATNANDSRLDTLRRQYDLAEEQAAGLPVKMLVYGGSKKTSELCEKLELVHIRDARNEARDG